MDDECILPSLIHFGWYLLKDEQHLKPMHQPAQKFRDLTTLGVDRYHPTLQGFSDNIRYEINVENYFGDFYEFSVKYPQILQRFFIAMIQILRT
jgi:hypothetical protein